VPDIAVRRVKFSQRWEDINGVRAQAVAVTFANLLPNKLLSKNTSLNGNFVIEVAGRGIRLVQPGTFHRLTPGDQVTTDVFVTGSKKGTNATITLKDSAGHVLGTSDGWSVQPLIEEWTADSELLSMHETPTWVSRAMPFSDSADLLFQWNKAKYGILCVLPFLD
jgi:alpha-L-fucosidase